MRSALVVDDEEGVCRVLARVLARLGFDVRTCGSAEGALELTAQSERPFDLAIVDVVMPGMNGIELARRLREQFPRTRIVLTSGHDLDELEGPGRAGGSLSREFSFLRKPFVASDVQALCSDLPRATPG